MDQNNFFSQAGPSFTQNAVSVSLKTGQLLLSFDLFKKACPDGIDVCPSVSLSYISGSEKILGLPRGWAFNIDYIDVRDVTKKELVLSGKRYLIDFDWSAKNGYRSGLKYLNDKNILFEESDSRLDDGRDYAYKLRAQEKFEYFDEHGLLLRLEGMYKDKIDYFYTFPDNYVFDNFIEKITDSRGQSVDFEYSNSQYSVSVQDRKVADIIFDQGDVSDITYALGLNVAIEYQNIRNAMYPLNIDYSNGLHTSVEYRDIPAKVRKDGKEGVFNIPVVQSLKYYNPQGNIVSEMAYEYGANTGHYFTGYPTPLSDNQDAVMEAKTLYQYDIVITKYDASGGVVESNTVYYNNLHQPLWSFDDVNTSASVAQYYEYPDYDEGEPASTVNYNKPTLVQYYYSLDQEYDIRNVFKELHASYNEYGNSIESSTYDRSTKSLVLQSNTKNEYQETPYGQKLKTSIKFDAIDKDFLKVDYYLSSDQKSVISKVYSYMQANEKDFTPYKSENFEYDDFGRVISKTVEDKKGSSAQRLVDLDEDNTQSELQYNYSLVDNILKIDKINKAGKAFSTSFDLSTLEFSEGGFKANFFTSDSVIKEQYSYSLVGNILQIDKVNGVGKTSSTSFDLSIPGAPLIKSVAPQGEQKTFEYDALGRMKKMTDEDGFVYDMSYSSYHENQKENTALVTDPLGRKVERVYDALGRKILERDNGYTQDKVDRVLETNVYNPSNKVTQTTNALGQATTFEYDLLGRQIAKTDSLGNKVETVYNDFDQDGLALSYTVQVNGVLNNVYKVDGLGRVVEKYDYPDTGDTEYYLLNITKYDGSNNVIYNEYHEYN